MTDDRPNIVFIITDQQRYDTIASLGFSYMDTPHLDRLVNEGVTFTQSFVTAPSCAPSRASLFTGLYPHSTGIFKNGDSWRHSWVELLADAGYTCVNIGKMHTSPFETPLGFHQRYVVENKDRFRDAPHYYDEWDKALRARGLFKPMRDHYRTFSDYQERLGAFEWDQDEELHADMFVGDLATWWIEKYPRTEPLFLEIGFPGPHPPYDPVPRYAEPYLQRDLPLPEVNDAELAGQPPPLQELRREHMQTDIDGIVHLENPTPEQQHRQRAYYFANVTMIDEKIGQILEALERKGYLDNTVVIFTSDHGDCLGDHGHSQKWNMYDIVTRTPLIVWSLGRFQKRKVSDLIQLMDIGPTILELAGISVPDTLEARSLMSALESGENVARRYVFAEHGRDKVLTGTSFMTMIRDTEWKLVHYLGQASGELYDLLHDPRERFNLWDDPKCQERKQELLDAMREWLIKSNVTTKEYWASSR